MLIYLTDKLVNIYIIGLFIYTLLCFIDNSGLRNIQVWLGRFYLPLLTVIRAYVKPVAINGKSLDPSPLILIAVVLIARRIIFSLLFSRVIFI